MKTKKVISLALTLAFVLTSFSFVFGGGSVFAAPYSITEYKATEHLSNEISALAPNGNVDTPVSFSQTGPWFVQYNADGGAYQNAEQYVFYGSESSNDMNKIFKSFTWGGAGNPSIRVNYKDYKATNTQILTANLRSDYDVNVALVFNVPSSGLYQLDAADDFTKFRLDAESGETQTMSITAKIMINDQLLWTSTPLSSVGDAVDFPLLEIPAVANDKIKIIFERNVNQGNVRVVDVQFKPVIKKIGPTFVAAEHFSNEISALSSGNMSSAASMTQSGPWYIQTRDNGGPWSKLTSYRYYNDASSHWMSQIYLPFSGGDFGWPHVRVNYKDYFVANPKVLTTKLLGSWGLEFSISNIIKSNGRYRLAAASYAPNFKVVDGGSDIDVIIKIYVNNDLKWNSGTLRTVGDTVAFPSIDFDANTNDEIRIEYLKNSAGGSYTEIESNPMLIKIDSPTDSITEQLSDEISALSNGNMSSAASITQAGPWKVQWYDNDGPLNMATSYLYINNPSSHWMLQTYLPFSNGIFNWPHVAVNYKDYNVANPKVVTTRLTDWGVEFALTYTVQNSGRYKLSSASDVPNIWVTEGSNDMDVAVNIYVNSTLKWSSGNLKATGDFVAFPNLDFEALKNDMIKIEIVKNSAGGYSDISMKPVLTRLIDTGSYNISASNKITNLTVGTTKERFLSKFNITSGTTATVANNLIGTGTKLTVTANSKTTEYSAILYGDVNGDANINVNDLAAIKGHLLKITTLEGDYLAAGEIVSNGKITISDLIALKKNLLGIANISQSK